ncbi:MAG: acyl-CoA thioesterase [Armatimonadetes bacterium]|nr:acyl-CoA thioesterase [Akkermansiaceae bacterium]
MDKFIHRYECEVAFSDTDASGWVHFSKILIYVERAEHELLTKLGLNVYDRAQGGWPRVRVICDYKRPLLFKDRIEIRTVLKSLGNSSVTWEFEVWKIGGELAAAGEMVSVKVNEAGSALNLSEGEKGLLKGGG